MAHRWRFFRAGGVEQVKLEKAADIAALSELDPKLWVALSCPTTGLECDPRSLQLFDLDHDGRIRAPEVVALAAWATRVLKTPDDLLRGEAALPLSAINDADPEGKRLLASAKQVLGYLGKADASAILVSDFDNPAQLFASSRWNGDGIVQATVTDDLAERTAIEDIISLYGGKQDRSGQQGVDAESVARYFQEASALQAHRERAPFAAANAAMWAAFAPLQAKIDAYFASCALSSFDARVAEATAMRALEERDMSELPLARPEPGKALPLFTGTNPAWTDTLVSFAKEVVQVAAPEVKDSLDAATWKRIRDVLAAVAGWVHDAPETKAATLPPERVAAFLRDGLDARLRALIAQDEAVKEEAEATGDVEKLVRAYRDLAKLLNNYVSFSDFYLRKDAAIFQAGTLYLDRRGCTLCLRVEDPNKHAQLASLSRIYLAYCECVRKSSDEKMCIVAGFTAGDSDNLMVGRNGVFFDRKGRDWDATIVKIVEHPISIRQAFYSPYKKVAKLIEQQIERFASARDKELSADAQAKIEASDKTPPKEPDKFDVAKFAGVFAAIGLAIGAIGGVLGTMVAAFAQLHWWQMPLAVGGIVLTISGASMILAALKLRKRNIGPLLDASGWAINAKAVINIPFGESLTRLATLPAGSERDLIDPYAQKSRLRVYAWLGFFLAAGGGAYCVKAGYFHAFSADWSRVCVSAWTAQR